MTRTNKILLGVAVAAAVTAGYWFALLAPKRDEAATLGQRITAKRAEVQQAQQQLASYEKARDDYKANYARLARIGKAVPGDDDVRSLMVQLDDASKRTGVDFQKIEIGGGTSGSSTPSTPTSGSEDSTPAQAPGLVPIGTTGVSALPFSFTFDGGFFALSDFFSHIEHFVSLRNEKLDVTGRLLRLETLEIRPSSVGYPHMQAQVGAASYTIPPLAKTPTGSAATAQPSTGQPSSGGGPEPTTTTATVTGAVR